MKPKIFFAFFSMIIFAASLYAQNTVNSSATEGLVGKTEVRYWDQSKAYNGYTLFGAKGKTYLIDMEGYVVHQWNVGTNPRLLENGNILDASKSDPSGFDGFIELDWNGNTVWTYTEKRSNYFPHHDWTRIFNKKLNAYTTLYIANKNISNEDLLAAGADPSRAPYSGVQMDAIVEIDMNGNVVWEWWFFDHIIQDIDAVKNNYVGSGKKISDYPGKLNINLTGVPLRKDWLHCNSVDFNPDLDQIVINSVAGEFYIIDHGNTFIAGNPEASIAMAATSAGDFLYRFGDPARYGQGNPPSVGANWTTSTTGNKQIGGSHDVHWVKPGLPGAGNIQIFNNGEYLFERTSQSYIFEVNPYYNSKKVNTGKYVNPPDAGYYTWIYPNNDAMKQNKLISNQVVWIYNSKNDQGFFSTIGGSEQRFPNGNTLICSDSQGHLFEVTYGSGTESPQMVWEYINPVTEDGIKQVIIDQYPMYNSVFRAYRYSADDPALKDKVLSKGTTITGKTPDYLTPSDILAGAELYDNLIPSDFKLEQNYPNPFNPETTINFSIKTITSSVVRPPYMAALHKVSLKVYDVLGREVAVLVDGEKSAGNYSVRLDASNLSSGIYFYKLTAGNFTETKKMTILK